MCIKRWRDEHKSEHATNTIIDETEDKNVDTDTLKIVSSSSVIQKQKELGNLKEQDEHG